MLVNQASVHAGSHRGAATNTAQHNNRLILASVFEQKKPLICRRPFMDKKNYFMFYSTVTDLARFRGLSTSCPLATPT